MSSNDSPLGNSADGAQSQPREITPHQVARTKPLPVMIDIRTEDEFVGGHIAGAEHISRDELGPRVHEIVPELTTPILVYCAVGNQAPSAAERLVRMGYCNVFSLKGGLRNWLEAGGTVDCSKSSSLAGIH
jgi:rhodanese-related sulfurtransferase